MCSTILDCSGNHTKSYAPTKVHRAAPVRLEPTLQVVSKPKASPLAPVLEGKHSQHLQYRLSIHTGKPEPPPIGQPLRRLHQNNFPRLDLALGNFHIFRLYLVPSLLGGLTVYTAFPGTTCTPCRFKKSLAACPVKRLIAPISSRVLISVFKACTHFGKC